MVIGLPTMPSASPATCKFLTATNEKRVSVHETFQPFHIVNDTTCSIIGSKYKKKEKTNMALTSHPCANKKSKIQIYDLTGNGKEISSPADKINA